MAHRRILSLWFPRIGAERLLRQTRMIEDLPFAVVQEVGHMKLISSLSITAEARGLSCGQSLRDAMAIWPGV